MHGFIKQRTSTKNFNGLPLTVVVFTILFILATFVGLTEDIMTSDLITQIDIKFTQFLFQNRTAELDQYFYSITQFGSIKVISVLLFGLVLSLFLHNKKDLIFPLFITLIGTEIAVFLIKITTHRPRPGEDIAYYLEKTFSFPSGHSALAMAFYGFIIYFLLRIEWSYKTARFASVFLIVLILLVGFSRIYLGVHYISDVLGGFLIGAVWLLLSISLREILALKKLSPPRHKY